MSRKMNVHGQQLYQIPGYQLAQEMKLHVMQKLLFEWTPAFIYANILLLCRLHFLKAKFPSKA